MTKTFTQNDVIRYFYNEVTAQEKQDIENALLWDNTLVETYQELVEMGFVMNKIQKEPSNQCIDNILNYSRTYSMHTA